MLRGNVLIVDDEADIRELLGMTLRRMGLEADNAANEWEAVQLLQKTRYDLCLTDMRLPDGDGLHLVEHIAQHCPGLPVAVITAHGSMENAVAALKAGAFDYLSKPVSLNQLRTLVKSALKTQTLALALDNAHPEPAAAQAPVLLGNSPGMQHTRDMIEKLARSQAPVFISGESGSGKELAARLIHLRGSRRDEPFVAVNCGAIPENLMESEFFGYKRGAFTGAERDREGHFHAANGGTLFLDEVAELPLMMQVKLLRVIQEKEVRRVGATQEEAVDARIISATHRNLGEAVDNSQFRQDLYYRLHVIELKMPALREMREDIPLLVEEIVRRQAAQLHVNPPRVSAAARKVLEGYAFPGNVRELENILERAFALSPGDEIQAQDLLLSERKPAAPQAVDHDKWPLQEYLDRVEKEAILEALKRSRFNKTAAAKLLGITFRALRYRLERLRID
ncbi:MAG: sigma-54-dependent transcriptional regulator [Burkholderiales bacterium]